jgi:hypothetical protein
MSAAGAIAGVLLTQAVVPAGLTFIAGTIASTFLCWHPGQVELTNGWSCFHGRRCEDRRYSRKGSWREA